MSRMIEVKVDDLIGKALDWAVDSASTGQTLEVRHHKSGSGEWMFFHDGLPYPLGPAPYSTDWAKGGPLVFQYGVLLSPPKSMVHRNYGHMDRRNGYYESGVWGATIFGAERKHRRRAFDHPDQPLVAAMRAIVQFELGDVVRVPAELMEAPRA